MTTPHPEEDDHPTPSEDNEAHEDDGELFRRAMDDLSVTPTSSSPTKKPAQPRTRPTTEADEEFEAHLSAKFSEFTDPDSDSGFNLPSASTNYGTMVDHTQGNSFAFARSGLQKRYFRRLKSGDYRIIASTDLHGCTAAEAETKLRQFLYDQDPRDRGCLLIIHGKGIHSDSRGAVLKQFTANWLKLQPPVKAFCSAQPRDGGNGAVYVLLNTR